MAIYGRPRQRGDGYPGQVVVVDDDLVYGRFAVAEFVPNTSLVEFTFACLKVNPDGPKRFAINNWKQRAVNILRIATSVGRSTLSILALAACCVLGWSSAAIAEVMVCGTGQTVQGNMGGGAPGTIAEVGTTPPHVGWYRIVFGWNAPNGDWYEPSAWDIRPTGGGASCRAPSAAAAATGSAAPSVPQTQNAARATVSTERCPSGTRAVDRKQRQGRIDGETNGMCRFVLDDGSTESLLPWMLSAVGANQKDGGGLAPGSYTCTTNGAGIFRVTLEADGDYVDRAGKSGQYRLNADGSLSFDSGSLQGYYGRTLPGGRFGLGARKDSILATVCDRKG